jgi:copper chaperone
MTTTHTFRVTGMHCGSCAVLIDDTLDDLPGVHATHTSARTGRSVVELDGLHTTPADVVATIADLGYHAEPLE